MRTFPVPLLSGEAGERGIYQKPMGVGPFGPTWWCGAGAPDLCARGRRVHRPESGEPRLADVGSLAPRVGQGCVTHAAKRPPVRGLASHEYSVAAEMPKGCLWPSSGPGDHSLAGAGGYALRALRGPRGETHVVRNGVQEGGSPSPSPTFRWL